MPGEDERESVVLIQDCNLLASCRVSFTCMLTWSDFIRYWGPYEAEELLPLLEDELPDCCAGALAGAATPELEPLDVAELPQAASRSARMKRIPRLPWRTTRLRLLFTKFFLSRSRIETLLLKCIDRQKMQPYVIRQERTINSPPVIDTDGADGLKVPSPNQNIRHPEFLDCFASQGSPKTRDVLCFIFSNEPGPLV